METWQVVLAGVAGGAFPDILRVIRLRHEPDKASYLRTGTFWLGFALLLFAGGVAAYLTNQTTPLTIVTALAVGFTAPEVLSRFFGADGGGNDGGEGDSGGPVPTGAGGRWRTEARTGGLDELLRWWGH
jgi:hypothetical protein